MRLPPPTVTLAAPGPPGHGPGNFRRTGPEGANRLRRSPLVPIARRPKHMRRTQDDSHCLARNCDGARDSHGSSCGESAGWAKVRL